ncbi:LLM class flavin-dependent oxidoreductase [Streptosporangium amethystogenes]|uniref:LLM class flavin-dependent oxidoreductase n=1 Tax=Streptosporangium amethystogenes TaxID=2002 RepID=UPI0037B869FD
MTARLNVTLEPSAWAALAPAGLVALVGRLEAAGAGSVVLTDPASAGEPGPWRWDPPTAIAALAGFTSGIGLVTTVATGFTEPLSASRLVGSLDHFTRGRVGWLLDAGHDAARAARTRAVSPVLTTGDPVARAIELVAAARSLWDGWQEGAFAVDVERGAIIDRERVHASNFEGRHFRVAGPSTLRRPPSGNPPVFVRVTDDADVELAGAVADVALVTRAALGDRVRATAERAPAVLASLALNDLDPAEPLASGIDGIDLVVGGRPDLDALATTVAALSAALPPGRPGGPGLRGTYALPTLRD